MMMMMIKKRRKEVYWIIIDYFRPGICEMAAFFITMITRMEGGVQPLCVIDLKTKVFQTFPAETEKCSHLFLSTEESCQFSFLKEEKKIPGKRSVCKNPQYFFLLLNTFDPFCMTFKSLITSLLFLASFLRCKKKRTKEDAVKRKGKQFHL